MATLWGSEVHLTVCHLDEAYLPYQIASLCGPSGGVVCHQSLIGYFTSVSGSVAAELYKPLHDNSKLKGSSALSCIDWDPFQGGVGIYSLHMLEQS